MRKRHATVECARLGERGMPDIVGHYARTRWLSFSLGAPTPARIAGLVSLAMAAATGPRHVRWVGRTAPGGESQAIGPVVRLGRNWKRL